jgi:hypothetical protein
LYTHSCIILCVAYIFHMNLLLIFHASNIDHNVAMLANMRETHSLDRF